jgi:hypothetical protein
LVGSGTPCTFKYSCLPQMYNNWTLSLWTMLFIYNVPFCINM